MTWEQRVCGEPTAFTHTYARTLAAAAAAAAAAAVMVLLLLLLLLLLPSRSRHESHTFTCCFLSHWSMVVRQKTVTLRQTFDLDMKSTHAHNPLCVGQKSVEMATSNTSYY